MSLLRYTIKRLLQVVPVLLIVAAVTFIFVNSMPGNPFAAMFEGQGVSEETVRSLERQFGLDRPIHERFISYVANLAQGNLGYSINYKQSVTSLMLTRIPPTLMLVLSAFAFALVTAIPLGVLSASRRNKPTDHVSRIVALFGVSTPSFWIGIMSIIVFAVYLGWLPAGQLVYPWRAPADYGYGSTLELYYQSIRHLILPMIALGTLQMATLMRVERSSMVESLQEEYVELARAYGVSERKILRKHAFRPAQLPIITIVGLNLSTALGGSVVIEQVFSINGMGKLLLESIKLRDYQVVMGITIVIATIFIIGVVITDIAYAYIDPRVSYGESE